MTDSKKSNQQQPSVETLGLSGHDSDNIVSKKTPKAINKKGQRTSDPNDIAIKVSNVSKTFKLPHEKHSSIKGALVGVFNSNRSYEKQRVLKDISFEIKKGEFFGIVGRNGSGKSTLLKLLAGIYSPDEGKIQINGKLTPFIELGVGFNPELTGRENVFLNGALLGFSRKEMAEMYDEIVEFAELEKFMDQKLKNYSSGMQVRLAFSIAIRADTDILVLDEVLAVGDESFQNKCFSYFSKLKQQQKTVILVTHDMSSANRFCNRALLINDGKMEIIGETEEVTKLYETLNRSKPDKPDLMIRKNDYATVKIQMLKDGKPTDIIFPEDALEFDISIFPKKTFKNAFIGFTIQKLDGEFIFWYTTEGYKGEIGDFKTNKEKKFQIIIDNIFGNNNYKVNLSIKSNDRSREYVILDNILEFRVEGRGKNGWMYHPDYQVKVK
ncbi:MAG: ABC transporter ATP-binding protein [Candidatus Saccharimonadales bacterium]